MRKSALISLVLLAVAMPLFAQNAVIDRLTGKVEIKVGSGSWESASVGQQLPLNATISTGFGASALLRLADSILEVKQLTRLTLEELVEREGTVSTNVFVPVGRVRAEVQTTEGRSADFRVRTPLSTAAVRGTEFETNGWPITVSEGVVEFADLLGQARYVSATQISVSTGEGPTDPAEELDRNADIGDEQGPGDFAGGVRSSGYVTVRW
jgi:hypothetical protein